MDGPVIAVKHLRGEQLGGLVRQAGEDELGLGVELLPEETAEVSGGGGAVKAVVVIQHPYAHGVKLYSIPQKGCVMQLNVAPRRPGARGLVGPAGFEPATNGL